MSRPRLHPIAALALVAAAACGAGEGDPGDRRRGLAALEAGRIDAACRLLEAVTRQDAEDAEAWRAYAVACHLGDRDSAFLEAADRALALRPDDASLASLCVTRALALGEPEIAERALAALTEARPRAATTHLAGARVAFELGDMERAGELANRAAEMDDALAEAHHIHARVLAEAGDHAFAERRYRAALRGDPGHLGARDALARRLAETGRTAEAQEHRALHSAIAEATARRFRARSAEERRDEFQPLVDVLPTWVDGRLELARALFQLGDAAGARPHLEAALEVAPDHPRVHHLLGDVLAELGRARLAEQHHAAAVALSTVAGP